MDVRRLCKSMQTTVEKNRRKEGILTCVLSTDDQKKESRYRCCEMHIYERTPAPHCYSLPSTIDAFNANQGLPLQIGKKPKIRLRGAHR